MPFMRYISLPAPAPSLSHSTASTQSLNLQVHRHRLHRVVTLVPSVSALANWFMHRDETVLPLSMIVVAISSDVPLNTTVGETK